MTHIVLSVLLFLVGASAPDAPALSGAWTINGDVQGTTYTEQCTFTQTDVALTGKCGDGKISHDLTGKIDGDKITFAHDSVYNDQGITLNYTGKIATDGSFTGSVEVEPFAVDGTFTATRTPVPAAAP